MCRGGTSSVLFGFVLLVYFLRIPEAFLQEPTRDSGGGG